MPKTREIRGRMKAVANIKRITKTMQMIATAKFQASQRRVTASKPYSGKIAELVGELAAAINRAGGGVSHPLLASPQPAVGRQLLLVLSSSRGLCGGYNGNVLRKAAGFLREQAEAGGQTRLELVGKKGQSYFRFQGTKVDQFHSHFTDKPAYDDVEALAERYMAEFAEGQYDAVNVAYMAFETASRQTPTVRRLLPLEPPKVAEQGKTAATEYEFSPQPDVLLNELLPITVKTTLFQCFNEAAVGEHIARMVAMKAATDAATKMGKDLTRVYNRARQAAITTELSEIIAGAAALD